MSCNPAIGGVGKGQIVREIDALGGVMGRAIDATGIQFRMLNRRKGPAMHSPRAQADKKAYQAEVKRIVEEQPNLTLRQEVVEDLLTEDDGETGRASSACDVRGDVDLSRPGRRAHDRHVPAGPHAHRRSEDARRPRRRRHDRRHQRRTRAARLPTRAVQDRHAAAAERPDDRLRSRRTAAGRRRSGAVFVSDRAAHRLARGEQLPCYITYTNEAVHELIRANLHRAPMYSGQIQSSGPRYCPSIEDKVVRFADKDRHQLFLEPEGRNTREVYVNGISTSLPRDVQDAIFRLIPGLERAEIMRYGYAVEYDYAPPDQLAADARNEIGRAGCTSPGRSTARPATKKRPPKG